jgi:hypothetical protein
LGVFRLRYGVHPEGVEEVTPERLAEIRQTVQGWHPFVSEEPDAPRLIATELLAEVERLTEERDGYRMSGDSLAQMLTDLYRERDRLILAIRFHAPKQAKAILDLAFMAPSVREDALHIPVHERNCKCASCEEFNEALSSLSEQEGTG